MPKRVVFSSCVKYPEMTASDRLFADDLEKRGYEVECAAWNGAQEAFQKSDIVILRSHWDYHLYPRQFRSWLEELRASKKAVFNTPNLVLWNLNKKYLLDLKRQGVLIPQSIVEVFSRDRIQSMFEELRTARLVVKPLYGASSYQVALVEKEHVASVDQITELWRDTEEVLIQEYIEEVSKVGEISCIFFNGIFSHAVRKTPAKGDFRCNPEFGSSDQLYHPDDDVVRQAKGVLEVLPEIPLYARVDGVLRNKAFVLMELEINEPHLFFDLAPAAADRMADALEQRLK